MFSKLQTILPFQKVYVSLLFYGILELNSVIVYQRGMKVMRLGMAQMSMSKDMDENFAKTLDFCDKAAGCNLLFFPEVQFSPFFAQYEKQDATGYLMEDTDQKVQAIQAKCREHDMYISPNFYLKQQGKPYDANLFLDRQGRIAGISKMVHIFQAPQFYECDYYTPSEEGFQVFTTEFGKIGIVICFDRHLPESIRSCAAQGADLVIVPTANTKAEPLEMFEWEMRVQAYQNQTFVAMCNRVGKEGDMDFAGQSLIIDPRGNLLAKGDDQERLIACDLDLSLARKAKEERPFLKLRRPDMYQ